MNETQISLTNFGSVIVGLLVVGSILKNAFPSFPNRLVPLVTWTLGIVAYLILSKGWSDAEQWLAAVLASASATGIHSGIKNTIQARSEEPPTP